MSVYADHITFARHSFPSNESLGSDWVTGIRVTDDKPYSFASRAQKAQSPQFPAHAQITLKKEVRTTPKVENYPAQKKGSISLTFPQAYPKKEARVYQYELVASNSKGEEKSFFAIANGYNFPLSAPEVTPTMTISIPCDRLPKDVNLFRIYPMNYWRTKGKPIQLKI